MTQQEKYAERIAKLLRKAESTTPAEAEALVAKAQELMISYAISEDMLAAARGDNAKMHEEILQKDIKYTGIFQAALMNIGTTIARYNDCRCVYVKDTWSKPTNHTVKVAGHESDVDRVIMLDASLQIQCARAMNAWWSSEDRGWYSKMDAFKARRDFIFGFASGLAAQLNDARQRGVQEAAKQEATRTNTTEQAASESVALVLRSKKERVDEWMDNTYGRSLRSVSRNYQSGRGGGHAAGHAAGRSADTGRSSLRNRGQLGR